MKKSRSFNCFILLHFLFLPNFIIAQQGVIDGGCVDNRFIKILNGERNRNNEREEYEVNQKLLSGKKAIFETSIKKRGINKTFVIQINPSRKYFRKFKRGDCKCSEKISGKITIYEKNNPSRKSTARIIEGVIPTQDGNWPWEHGAYATCFFAAWAGHAAGGGEGIPPDAYDYCKNEWLD